MRNPAVGILALTVLVAGGCHSSNSKQAVQQAVEKHIKQRADLLVSNMNMEFQDVKFEGDNATADVRYVSKQVPDVAMVVRYQLQRSADASEGWIVKSSAPVSTSGMSGGPNPHGGPIDAPPPNIGPPPKDQPKGPSPQSSH